MFFRRKVKLPTTPAEFDLLVDRLMKKYKFSDRNHTAGILSIAIRHLPSTQAYATLDYFAQYIQKNIANFVAHVKGENLNHENKVDQLVSLLKEDPNNFEARDHLQKAASDGSQYAINALAKYEKALEEPKTESFSSN